MNPWKVAAEFAAYVWFEATQRAERSEEEKACFARKNWRPFEAVAPEGLGRLLLKISGGRAGRPRRRKSLCPTARLGTGDKWGRRNRLQVNGQAVSSRLGVALSAKQGG
jgi:hypothetical protein